jgi:Flp pilus assembly protein TadG
LGTRGVSTIEFAIVGPLFLLLLLAIFELGYMVFVQSVLDGAARDAARLIRTGQAQETGNAQGDFQTMLCNSLESVIGCGNLIYQSQTFDDWSDAQTAISLPPVRDKNGNLVSAGFATGTARSIVVVQVTYNYQFFTTWIANYLGGSTQSSFLESTVVFQNEPYT